MEKKDLWILLGKKLSGEITPEERRTLDRLMQEEGQQVSYLIEFLEEEWKRKAQPRDPEDPILQEPWEKLQARLPEPDDGRPEKATFLVRRKPALKWYHIAASLLMLLGLGYWFSMRLSVPRFGTREITVANGMKKHLTLPDGTQVWLNAGSRLWYKNSFAHGNRDIWLEGEGFFKVRNDASFPFTVYAGTVTIRVLGTNFNVKAYRGDPDIQTTLITGKIQVQLKDDPDKKITLSPHEKLTVMSEGKAVLVHTNLNPEKQGPAPLPRANELKLQVQALPLNPRDSTYFTETAWVRNQFAFAYQPFSEVAEEMERRYNVHIIFRDSSLRQVVMSGVFEKETVSQALDVLRMITPFAYRERDDTIFLYK